MATLPGSTSVPTTSVGGNQGSAQGQDPRDVAETEGGEEIEEEGPSQHAAYQFSKATPLSLVGTFFKFFMKATTKTSL